MNKALIVLLQFLGVIALDALVIGVIYVEAEKSRTAQAAMEEKAKVAEVALDARTGLPLDPKTRLIVGPGYEVIKAECVKCHPTQIIRSFHADRATWLDALRWMQREKGLRALDPATEETILTYLTTYYGK